MLRAMSKISVSTVGGKLLLILEFPLSDKARYSQYKILCDCHMTFKIIYWLQKSISIIAECIKKYLCDHHLCRSTLMTIIVRASYIQVHSILKQAQ
ncbi:hypothetical protein TSAR_015926 [Trichomalopsis sarcophagae]|uniref:Uncharacterized protein n=1 Tax=Trichomalopsis sarcophagae TaxID=543379 RepID=A0A232EE90_9HYME|nr:hypothetical protein TSAR_015926 [Trichomalopsis sarcophagae]